MSWPEQERWLSGSEPCPVSFDAIIRNAEANPTPAKLATYRIFGFEIHVVPEDAFASRIVGTSVRCEHPPETVICGPLYPDGTLVPGDGRPQNIREQDEDRPQWCSRCGASRWYRHQDWTLPPSQNRGEES